MSPVHDGTATGGAKREHLNAPRPALFIRIPRSGGAAAWRACAVVVLMGAAIAAVLGQNSAMATSSASQESLASSNPGTLIGPTHTKSISFLVLLRSAAQPTCLQRWASSAQLSAQWSTGQRWVTISGAPRNVDRSFHVSINDYRSPSGSVAYAANHQAGVPSGVCGEVAGVGTIHSLVQPRNFIVPPGGLNAADLMTAYDATPLTEQGYQGQGETVVFMEEGGFLQSDFNTFAADQKLPPFNVTLVGKNTGYDDETTLDIETVHEIAPQAHEVFFNMNSITKATSDADYFAQAFTEAAKLYPGAVISMSIGECETNTQAFNRSDLIALNAAVASIEAKGSTVFASSGDSGGLECTPDSDFGQPPEASWEGVNVPAALPAVTGTGGTALTTDASGNYIGETTWSEPLLSQGTAGGVSVMFKRPSWQTGVGTGGQVDTDNGREVPDVSSDSDPNTGNAIIEDGNASQGGGTSLAAPTWAAFTALMDQYLKANHDRPVGFFNPILYHLARSPVPYPPFHDVTVGGNDFFLATPGYDMATGLGSPIVYNLARDLKAGKY
jgi:kumamolisin